MKAFHSIVLCVIFVLFGCGDKKDDGVMGAVPVQTSVIETQNVELEFEYPAKLKSVRSVDIYARVEGILLEQNFTEGDIVTQGQILFTIDPARYDAKVRMAKAQHQSAQANFRKAQKDFKRVERLYKQGVHTVDTYDNSLYNYESAQANLDSTKASLDDAMIDLDYTRVSADITGKTGMRRYDIGTLVGRNGGNDILTTITQLSPIYTEFSIPSNDFLYIRDLALDNVKVEIVLSNNKIYHQKGKINFIDSVLDAQTNSIKARAIVDNEDYKLLPNEFVRVRLKGFIAQNAIIIPQKTLGQDAQGSYVYVVKDNKASLRRVSIGRALKDGTVLITGGLKSKDLLISSNLGKVSDGADVQVVSNSSKD